ncbi:hypothetical protein G6F46_005015 [Rhizopus delemar]|nr:hypothetical protein G6F55_004875 [Rhizopus delemar]KAG1543914.1 hypothetical protein G6F51_006388 [Rhizopus arrhizus]KAG1499623.1 hypothetical protein G6F54_004284 [Rhizopus delemar]KAG1511467.1 hypothetical protein G6F53_005914 [Rhizopus delemar]KAG1525764.1 hypothetical protein G6F52_003030 [Rhizopus delemar]
MSLFSKLSKNNDKALYPWSQKKLGGTSNALPRVRHAAAAISSDAILIYGGVHRGTPKKDILLIDTNTMSAMSMMTIGDIPNTRISPTILHFNSHILQNKQWSRLPTDGKLAPSERAGHSCVMHEGIIYIWGGQKEGRYLNDLFLFNINPTPRWDQLNSDSCPEPRAGHISAIYEDKMYIFGGTNGKQVFNDLWSFDFKKSAWAKIDPNGSLPVAREGCSSAVVDDIIYIFGGRGEDGVQLNDLCAYKIKNRYWFTFQNMGPSPSPRHGQTITAIGNRLFVVGGDNDFAKMEDASHVYILDSTKIKFPLESTVPVTTQPPSEEKVIPPRDNSTEAQYQPQSQPQPVQPQPVQPQQPYLQRQQSLQNYQAMDQKQRNEQASPAQKPPLRVVPNANSPNNEAQQDSPTTGSPVNRSYYRENQPPPRPPRHASVAPEAALLRPRTTSSPNPSPIDPDSRHPYPTEEGVIHEVEELKKDHSTATDEEREMLLREIKSRDAIIEEMKKKENWWRAEVAMARKLQGKNLVENDLPQDQAKVLQQLITVKAELDRVRQSILQQAEPMSDKVQQADRMRTAALQEAAYFKSKYLAIKSRRQSDLEHLEISRSDELERRLAVALAENETKSKLLIQLQKRSEHDQAARLATEERAKEAHERAEEAQGAHQRALEELQAVYARATRAEAQVRENTIKIVNLTQQLSETLTAQPAFKSQDVSEAQLKASQLEAANLKARNESAALRQKLAESMDDIDRLTTALHEREDALTEAKMNIEDYEIQLNMLRDAVNQKSPVNGMASTPAY